ncbi:helix-turn-helix domain-containing protein [Segnochrobactrum spirostomi]|nr:helix-turn-helix domain-containing protein [Segnochrobactrum spirostomi]
MARFFVHLSLEERRVIARMHGEKSTQAEIARTLRRDRSTICRELRRNFWHNREVPFAESYWHLTAHDMAADRRRRYRKLRRHRRASSSALRVHELIQASPIVTIQTVSEKLDVSFPTASAALENLAKVGVVRETTGRQRGRIYAYSDYLLLLDRGTDPLPV